MVWTPPSDAVVADDKSWTPPKDAVLKGAAPAQAKADEAPVETSDAMGADFGAAIMGQAAKREPKTYTGSVFDTQPFEPPFDAAEAARLSRRAYAEQTTKPPRREPPSMTESPEYVGRPRTAGETALDLTAALSKGTTGFFKGILNNIPGEPGTDLFGGMEQRAERLTSPITRGSEIARQGQIARAQQLEGEVGAARATYQSMFTPAGVQVITQGAGSIIPSVGLSLAGLSAKAVTAANMLSNAGDAAVQSAEQLKQVAPEQWSKNEVYRSLREQGLSHRDAVSMLAPIYAMPAQITGAITGAVSGSTGLEKALISGTKRGAMAAAGRAGAEMLGEQVESVVPQFVGNLVASTIDPKISPVQGLGQTAIETAFGTLPGAGLAALPSKRVNVLNSYAQSKGYADVEDMIRKTVPTVGRKAVEDELIEALDVESDQRDIVEQEAAAEREAIQQEGEFVPPADAVEAPEPPDIFGTPSETAAAPVVPTTPTPQVETPTPAGDAEAVAPAETPLRPWLAGINPTLDKFYDENIGKPVESFPKELQQAKGIIDRFNDGLTFVKERLAKWDHPAITGATESERRMAKTKNANAEERELLDLEGELAGLGVRAANQFMALAKGYKGKKAGSMAKIEAAEDEAFKLFNRAMDLMYARGLLTEEEAADWEESRGITKPEAGKPEEAVSETIPPIQEEELPQTAPVDKPAPITDLQQPQEAGDTTTPAPVEDKPYYGSEETNALGDKIKNFAERKAADYMVGDMVRYGNTSGVVVGVDDSHVKVHPDGAKSPKAYYRVPKASVEFIARPDTVSKTAAMALPGEDKKFGSEEAELSMDKAGILKLLGANMYAASAAEVAVKELLQNSFDAVKGAVSDVNGNGEKVTPLYKSGEITIEFNDSERTITITDNGRGMTPDIVRKAFFTVAKSDKSDLPMHKRSGGKGVAKLGFMLGSEWIKVDTVRDGVRTRVDATADQIAGKTFQIVKTPASKKEHGTVVTVRIPETYTDENGDERDVFFSGNPEFYKPLNRPLLGPVVIKTIRKNTWKDDVVTQPLGLNFPADNYTPLKVNFGWGAALVYFGKERIGESYRIKHQVLSAGVYQFDTEFKMGDEKIPYDIIVDIESNVGAQNENYPITNNRETFTPRVKEDIAALNAYLAQIARGNEAQGLQDNFKNIVSMPRIDVGQELADTTKKLQKSFDRRGTAERRELPPMPKEVRVEGTRVVATDTGRTVAEVAKQTEKGIKKTFQAEVAAPEMEDFLLQMAQNPSQPIFHNNTNVDFLEVGRQYGNPEVFFAELGTLMVEMKEALANSGFYKYDQLKPENLFFGGVSIDKGYGGVHIKVPYKAVLVNPFYDFGAKTLFGVAEYLWETMTHEIAHTGDMGHGVGHNTHMLKVRQYLADEGLKNYFQDAILEALTRHESAFTAMREAYGRSTTKNTARSLKEFEKGSASASDGSAASRDPDAVRPLPAGRGQGGYGNIRPAGPLNPTSGVARTDRSLTPDSVKGLHQDVVDAINRNDVSAALRAISRNTSGWYAELARRLAEIKLPSNIVFNNERALVRQIIDDRSAQQQIRLFAYVARVAPEFYDKYFKNYDRVENLESVYEGLRKLPDSGINVGPVNTELGLVRYVYNKNMPGLTAPGFFAPTLDTINIRPDPTLGSRNRVVLHEVVHAATEYMLNEQVADLTPEQQQAIKDIREMYRYAQSKLKTDEYGFTNLSEFVAEIMTNPGFQNKLKDIPYPARKTSVLNSFLRFIATMFGMRNLTGEAMSAINDILSPQRPASGIKVAPLRFATQPRKKRVRGPVSTPDTWRTAEKVQVSTQDMLSDAASGRVPVVDAIKDLTGALWNANGTAVRAVMLPVLQLRQLKDLVRNKLPQLTGGVDIVEKMVSYRGQKIRIAEKLVQTWGPLQGRYPKQSSLMARVMLEATIRGRDPDDGVPSGAAPDALDKAWNALRPEFKQLYRDVRDFYRDQVNEMVRTLKQRVIGLPKAERQEKLRKINEQFGPDKLLAPYFPLRRFGTYWFQVGKGEFKEFYTFESAFARNRAFNKRRRMLQNGNALQKAAAETMRMGDGISQLYSQNVATTQVLKDVVEMVDSLSTTRTPPSQKEYTRLENILKAKLGRLPTKAEVEDKYYTETLKSEVKDSLNQLIYLLLPQQSMRKMFVNRRAIQGASSDMLRVFAETSVRSAYQMARFKYAEPFVNNINNARDHIDSMEAGQAVTPQQGAVYRDYVMELERRTGNILGVEDRSPLAQTVGSITGTTFYFMLSAPASALLNIVGMAQLAMPYIGGRYGYAKTNAKMLKYMALYGASLPQRSLAPMVMGNFAQVSFPSIVESSFMAKMDPILQRAAQRFIDDGDINISMTNDIFDLSEHPSALYTGKTNAVKKLMSGVFHQAERFNREVTLLTVFELAYDKYSKAERRDLKGVVERDPSTGKPLRYKPSEAFELALQDARDIAGLTMGDYTRQMKGRVFTYPTINLISQFKQYAITATYNVLRNFYLSVGAPFRKAEIEQFRLQMTKDGLPQAVIDQRLDEAEQFRKEVYREGMKRLAGILGMTFLFGGVAAQPFFSMLGQLIKMFAPDDDDEFFDWENWFYNYMETEVGGTAAAIFKKMGMDAAKSEEAGVTLGEAIARGPVPAVTGASLADRVSLDMKNLWWREGRYSPDARESITQDVIANIGPTVGLALNWADAWQLAGEGQWDRAYEKAAPAMFSKPATAYRLGTEGATNRAGDVVGGMYPDQFTAWQLGMQAIGIQPEKLAQAQKAAIQTKTYQQKILDRRNSLLNRLWMERGKPSYPDALEKANEFSLKYPEVAIDGDAITKSFDARAEAKAQAEAIGAKLDEKLLGRTAPMMRYGMR